MISKNNLLIYEPIVKRIIKKKKKWRQCRNGDLCKNKFQKYVLIVILS